MKKITKILLLSLLCGLLIIYGLYFMKNRQKLESEFFLKKEQELLTEIQKNKKNDTITTKQIHSSSGNMETFIFVPTNKEGHILPTIQHQMEQLSKKIVAKEKDTLPIKIVFKPQAKKPQKNIVDYYYVHDIYKWNKRKKIWVHTKEKDSYTNKINQLTGNLLTLGDIFTNQQNLLIINRNIQEELLKKSNNSPEEIEAILNLPLLKDSSTNFELFHNKVVLHYPKNYAKVIEYSLPFNTVGPYLNKDFVASKYILETKEAPIAPEKKQIALTFDDGPSKQTTPTILNTLKEKNVKATFFILGQEAEKNPDIINRMAKEGHDLANHSYSHPNYTTLTEKDVRKQINKTQAIIYEASGVLPRYARPPYGSFDYLSAVNVGLPIVNWSVDSLDWKSKDQKKILKQIEDTSFDRSILLLHDIHEETMKSLPKVIDLLKKQGYEFVTITELLQNEATPLTAYYSGVDQRNITK